MPADISSERQQGRLPPTRQLAQGDRHIHLIQDMYLLTADSDRRDHGDGVMQEQRANGTDAGDGNGVVL